MHVAKNFMADRQAFDTQTRVPLILGIWGPKGQGKSFQTELCFKQLGLEPIIMSAGELEHEWAGTPGRLIRERYRRASEVCMALSTARVNTFTKDFSFIPWSAPSGAVPTGF